MTSHTYRNHTITKSRNTGSLYDGRIRPLYVIDGQFCTDEVQSLRNGLFSLRAAREYITRQTDYANMIA